MISKLFSVLYTEFNAGRSMMMIGGTVMIPLINIRLAEGRIWVGHDQQQNTLHCWAYEPKISFFEMCRMVLTVEPWLTVYLDASGANLVCQINAETDCPDYDHWQRLQKKIKQIFAKIGQEQKKWCPF